MAEALQVIVSKLEAVLLVIYQSRAAPSEQPAKPQFLSECISVDKVEGYIRQVMSWRRPQQ